MCRVDGEATDMPSLSNTLCCRGIMFAFRGNPRHGLLLNQRSGDRLLPRSAQFLGTMPKELAIVSRLSAWLALGSVPDRNQRQMHAARVIARRRDGKRETCR